MDIYVWYALAALSGGYQAETLAIKLKGQLSPDELSTAAEKLAAFTVRPPSDRWHFYTDMRGGHRWRRIAPNGRLVSASPVAYSNRNAAVADAERAGYRPRSYEKSHA